MTCGVGRRHSLDSKLLCLWRGLAATAPIQPLAWEPPYAAGSALKKKKKKKPKEEGPGHYAESSLVPKSLP